MPPSDLVIETAGPDETEAFGRRLAALLPDGCVVSLHGTLGAGKTVLARGLARGFGITEPVTSPTFTIVQEYPRPDGGRLYHLDLYRIQNATDAVGFGIEEFLFQPRSVAVVEWSERITELLEAEDPERRLWLPVTLEAEAAEERRRIRLPREWAERLGLARA